VATCPRRSRRFTRERRTRSALMLSKWLDPSSRYFQGCPVVAGGRPARRFQDAEQFLRLYCLRRVDSRTPAAANHIQHGMFDSRFCAAVSAIAFRCADRAAGCAGLVARIETHVLAADFLPGRLFQRSRSSSPFSPMVRFASPGRTTPPCGVPRSWRVPRRSN